MKSTAALAGLLAVVMLLIDLVVIRRWPIAPDVALVLFGGLATGQLALVTVWSVSGRAPWLVRLLAPGALAAWFSLPLAEATAGRWPEWFLTLTLFAAIVALPLGYLLRGARSADAANKPRRAATRAARGRLQYSLGGLMSWMTLIAVACALRNKLVFPWVYGWELAVYGVCLAAVAVGAAWASRSPGRAGGRVAGLTLVCLLAGWIMHAATGVRNISFFTLLTLLEALVICLGASVCAARSPAAGRTGMTG